MAVVLVMAAGRGQMVAAEAVLRDWVRLLLVAAQGTLHQPHHRKEMVGGRLKLGNEGLEVVVVQQTQEETEY
jgi:hypothetical protein